MQSDGFELIDNLVFFRDRTGELTLRIFAPDLKRVVPYIIAHSITRVTIETIDPMALYDWSQCRDDRILFNMRKISGNDVDLLPLKGCQSIKTLSLKGNIMNSDVLESLTDLNTLSIDNTLGKEKIRIDRLTNVCTLWIQKYAPNIVGIADAVALKELRLWNYRPRTRDLTELRNLYELVNLGLICPRIDTLDGIECLTSLERIEISYSKTLKDISAVDKCKRLIRVELDHVPKIIAKCEK